MASPTLAEINAQITAGIAPIYKGYVGSADVVTDIDTAERAAAGDFPPSAVVAGLANLRSLLSAANSPAQHRAIWNAWAARG